MMTFDMLNDFGEICSDLINVRKDNPLCQIPWRYKTMQERVGFVFYCCFDFLVYLFGFFTMVIYLVLFPLALVCDLLKISWFLVKLGFMFYVMYYVVRVLYSIFFSLF